MPGVGAGLGRLDSMRADTPRRLERAICCRQKVKTAVDCWRDSEAMESAVLRMNLEKSGSSLPPSSMARGMKECPFA